MKDLSKLEWNNRVVYYREQGSDLNVIKETLSKKGNYQRPSLGFTIEKGEKWLDLGANIGTFSLFCLSKGAIPVAYEPDPDNFNILKLNVPEIESFQSCVSSSKKNELTFYKSSKIKGKFSRITILPNKNSIKIGQSKNTFIGQLKGFDGIKMDIEGSELDIFDKDMVPECSKLVFEYHYSKDKSVDNFERRMKKLKKHFRIVHYSKGTTTRDNNGNFPFWHDQTIFCIK